MQKIIWFNAKETWQNMSRMLSCLKVFKKWESNDNRDKFEIPLNIMSNETATHKLISNIHEILQTQTDEMVI
jgi:hypothetical protein